MIKKATEKKHYTLSLLLCGFFAFSSMSSMLTQSLFHIPLSLPELFFIPFYFLLKKEIGFKPNYRVIVFAMPIYFIILLFIFYFEKYSTYSIFSTARGYLYIIIFFSIFYNKKIQINYIMVLFLGTVLGWAFVGIIYFFINADYGARVNGNLLAAALSITLPVIYKKTKFIFLSIILLTIIFITSSLRRPIIVALIGLFLPILIMKKNNFKSIIYYIVLILFLVILFSTLLPYIEQYMLSVSPFLHYRMFVKTQDLINLDFSLSDQVRINYLLEIKNSFFDPSKIFSTGFVSKRTFIDAEAGKFMDMPMLELIDTLGVFVLSICIIITIYFIIFHLKNFYKYDCRESAVNIVAIVIIFALLLLEGSFLNFPFVTPVTGLVLGRFFSKKNLNY